MNYEDFKDEFVEAVKDQLSEQGRDVRVEVRETNKLNESYAAITVTPEGSNVGVNVNLDKFYVGVDDLATLRPDIAEEWDYERNEFKPNQVLLQSNKSVWWICKRGHHWRAKIQDRAKGNGCPRCSGKTYVKTYIV